MFRFRWIVPKLKKIDDNHIKVCTISLLKESIKAISLVKDYNRISSWVENNRITWAWYPCHWWIKCNLWEEIGFHWIRQHRSQQTSLQTAITYNSWIRSIHLWCNPIWGNSISVNNRWQEDGWLLTWTKHHTWHQSW